MCRRPYADLNSIVELSEKGNLRKLQIKKLGIQRGGSVQKELVTSMDSKAVPISIIHVQSPESD